MAPGKSGLIDPIEAVGTVVTMDDKSCLVVGVDASAESLAAVEWALRLAEDLRRRVVAVHAVGLLEGNSLRPHPDVAATITAARRPQPQLLGRRGRHGV